MLVFWKQRLVLLAVPKTGTQAWEQALLPHASMAVLDPPELKHAPVYRYNKFFRPMFERVGGTDMDLVAVMREPVDWLGSWYRYRQRDFLIGKPNSTRGMTFDDFVVAACQPEPPPFAQVGTQHEFVAPRKNGIFVKHLFSYDAQDSLQGFLEHRLNATLTVPRKNVSVRSDLTLSAATRLRLETQRAAEFTLWDEVRQGRRSNWP